MKEHNEIDSLFESAFDGLTLTPDASVKENIDLAIASKKKRRRFFFILFPVLFGTVGFAAILYFHPFSGRTIQEKTLTAQNEKPKQILTSRRFSTAPVMNRSGLNETRRDQSRLTSTTKSDQSLTVDTKSTIYSKGKVRVKKSSFKTTTSSTVAKTPKRAKNKTTFTPGSKPVSPDTPTTPVTETKRTDLHLEKASEKPENKVAVSENTSDSIPSRIDSTNQVVAEVLKSTGNNLQVAEDNKDQDKWSLAVLTHWEGEKKRTANLENEPFSDFRRETGVIHSSTFYGKIELNYTFTRRWEMLTGVGFRSSKIVQYGYVDKIEFPIEGVGSVVPISPPIPDTVRHQEVQFFRVNSIVVPIGFGYSLPLGNKMRIRLAAGAEFAYGQFAKQTLHPTLSAPTLRPFGCSVWVRPELYYSFGRMELFGFGTFNQTLSQQLRWDFEPRRNPAFGGGIGLRIQL